MIKYLHFRIRLRNLFKKRDIYVQEYIKHRQNALKECANIADMESLRYEERSEIGIIDSEIEELTTSYFLKIARAEFLEIPDFNDETFWVESSLDPTRKVMSNKAIDTLRKKVRENRAFWIDHTVKIIAALTGLAGVLIGLFTIILKIK